MWVLPISSHTNDIVYWCCRCSATILAVWPYFDTFGYLLHIFACTSCRYVQMIDVRYICPYLRCWNYYIATLFLGDLSYDIFCFQKTPEARNPRKKSHEKSPRMTRSISSTSWSLSSWGSRHRDRSIHRWWMRRPLWGLVSLQERAARRSLEVPEGGAIYGPYGWKIILQWIDDVNDVPMIIYVYFLNFSLNAIMCNGP